MTYDEQEQFARLAADNQRLLDIIKDREAIIKAKDCEIDGIMTRINDLTEELKIAKIHKGETK